MNGKAKAVHDLAREELAPALQRLRSAHDVLPFMTGMIPASGAVFVPMPEPMVDVIADNSDFRVPERGGEPVWLEMIDEVGRIFQLIVARPAADGELWVLASSARIPQGRQV